MFGVDRHDTLIPGPGYPTLPDWVRRRYLNDGEHLADEPADLLRIWADGVEDLDTVDLPGVRLLDVVGRARYREAVAHNCSKAAAVAKIAAEHGLAAADVWAFGDGANDIDLLTWAGTGVAMRNAVPEAIAAADAMTIHTHRDDGVARLLERVLASETIEIAP